MSTSIDAQGTAQQANLGARAGETWGQVIGLPVTVADMATMTRYIVEAAAGRRSGYVCVANVHMLTTARRDRDLRQVLERAMLVVSDGMPLVWRLRHAGFASARQVRGPDLMIRLCSAAAERGLPVFFYGGDAALMGRLKDVLARRIPELVVAGAEPAPMLPVQPPRDDALIARICDSGARLLFVGLGCPKQEFWMQTHAPALDTVLIGVGQAFAIAAGTLPEAPEWMRRTGLEWLYRVASEPRRLWRRYLVTNSLFVAYVAQESLGGARKRREPT